MGILIAILVLGVLIFVHELGHFAVAKLMGVYVEKFSLGFGPRFIGFKYGETEYALSILPLGGYVKMYGQDGMIEGESVEDANKKGRGYTDKTRWQRALIALAGPVANILLAIVTFWFIFMSGVPSFSAVVGDVAAGSPAEVAGLKAGDKIASIDDVKIKSWDGFSEYIALNPDKAATIKLEDGKAIPIMIDRTASKDLYGDDRQLGSIGAVVYVPPIIADVVSGTPASTAGLMANDKIISINTIPVSSWVESTKIIRANPEQTLAMVVERDGKTVSIELTPKKTKEGLGQAGINAIRGDITVSYGVFESLKMGFVQSYEFTIAIFKGLGKLITRSVSTDELGGPIRIVEIGSQSAQAGFTALLLFMAIISMNLAIFNLLPIPVLDGGHLLILAIEGITRRTINERILGAVQTVGFVLLMSLMVFAFYNDITRLVTN